MSGLPLLCNIFTVEIKMKERKNKNKYLKKYREFYEDVVDYSIEVHQKFAIHNTFMFLLYGLGLNVIEIEM